MKSLSHQFLGFCRSKPADEEYTYFSARECACAQFCASIGLPWDTDRAALSARQGMEDRFLRQLGAVPYTFGALASRLEKALAK